jgi:hypothetical protein
MCVSLLGKGTWRKSLHNFIALGIEATGTPIGQGFESPQARLFLWAIFCAVVENSALNTKYVFHYLVEDSHRLNFISVLHDGSGSQRKTWGKKKLALACSKIVIVT